MEWTTDQKGTIAELAIAWEAIQLGIGVYTPVADGERCDLIFDLRPNLLRVQCKWAVRRGEAPILRTHWSGDQRFGLGANATWQRAQSVRSLNPRPLKIIGTHFSARAARVFACFAPET